MSRTSFMLRKIGRIAHFALLGIEALGQIVLAHAMVRFVPFRRYSKRLRQNASAEPPLQLARDLRRIIDFIARAMPERSRCLVCAIAARAMLGRRGYGSELSLGINPEQTPMIAHAWLIAGSVIVTGREEQSNFKEVARFN
jgi:hypothetical protein